jgi:hypothetical protein
VARIPEVWNVTPLDPRPAFTLYSAAAVLVPLIVPYTLTIMKDTNSKLHAKADAGVEAKEDGDLMKLFEKWQLLNAIRSVFPACAAIIGIWAVIAKPTVLT